MPQDEILVIGSSNTDMVVKTTLLPQPGETRLGGTFFMNAGGKGANQAVAAARLGGKVIFAGKVGNDLFGKQTIDGLNSEGINTDFIFTDEEAPSGIALITVDDRGENCIVVAPGANASLLPTDIEMIDPFAGAALILTQLEIPIETVQAIASKARNGKRRLIVNPAPAQALDDKLLDGLFLVTPNETETGLLTGITITDENTAAAAALRLLDKGVAHVIITLGSEGAWFQSCEYQYKIDAPFVEAVDTTGAGDTFNGALAVAITENRDWETAIRFAVRAASLSVTRLGAQSSIPFRREIGI